MPIGGDRGGGGGGGVAGGEFIRMSYRGGAPGGFRGNGHASAVQRNNNVNNVNNRRQQRHDAPSVAGLQLQRSTTVSKFLTFFQRKNTVVVEIYSQAFYARRPTWEDMAEFVYKDLCPEDRLRKDLLDVQLHPVKMLIFVKFKNESVRDDVAARLQGDGVLWSAYTTVVKGYSLDKEVKFIRIMGASPETVEMDVRETIEEQLGEVMEIKRGLLDPRRLPGVTNGMWTVKAKILDPDKDLPSYIHRQDEGEIWSLNFEGRRFVCWKCGSSAHIGDKCREPGRTFEETFPEQQDDETGGTPAPAITWAAVVRNKGALAEARKELEKKIADQNRERDRVRIEREQQRLEEERLEKERKENDAREREEARIAAEARARTELEEAERQRLVKERHDDFLRGQNKVAEDLGVALPEDNLSQASVDDYLLLGVISLSVVETVIGTEDMDGVEDKFEENLTINKDGNSVEDEDSDSSSSVDDNNLMEGSPVSAVKTGSGVGITEGVEDTVDENLVSNVEDKESDPGSNSGDSDDESSASKANTSGIIDPVSGVIHEISHSGSDEEDRIYSDGPKSSDYPVLRDMFNEGEVFELNEKRDRDFSDADGSVAKQLKLSGQLAVGGQQVDSGGGVGGHGEHVQEDGRVNEQVHVSLDKGGEEGDEDRGGELASLRHVVGHGDVSQGGQQDTSSSDKGAETGEDEHKHVGNLAGGKGGEGAASQ